MRYHTTAKGNIPFTAAEELARDAEEALEMAAQGPRRIREQIVVLEAQQTPRRAREAMLTGDKTFLSGLETQIAALRAKL